MVLINSIINKVINKIKYELVNYDLIYLTKKLTKKNMRTIIVGSSYSLFGLIESDMDSCVNLSLPSQDIYYSSKLIYNVVRNNKSVNKIVMSLSYYSFHFDLSSSKNERQRIERVYYPLLKDSHNYLIRNIFSLKIREYIWRYFTRKVNEKYFSKKNRRESVCGYFENKSKLDIKQKNEQAGIRASYHNKLIKYSHTKEENIDLLHKLIVFAKNNRLEIFFIVFPVSKYYSIHLDCNYKEQFYRFFYDLADDGFQIKLIDFFDNSIINEDEDIIDFDHLLMIS